MTGPRRPQATGSCMVGRVAHRLSDGSAARPSQSRAGTIVPRPPGARTLCGSDQWLAAWTERIAGNRIRISPIASPTSIALRIAVRATLVAIGRMGVCMA